MAEYNPMKSLFGFQKRLLFLCVLSLKTLTAKLFHPCCRCEEHFYGFLHVKRHKPGHKWPGAWTQPVWRLCVRHVLLICFDSAVSTWLTSPGSGPFGCGLARFTAGAMNCVCRKALKERVNEVKINEAREHPPSQGCKPFHGPFIMYDLNKINPMYQFSLRVRIDLPITALCSLGRN